MTERWKPDLRWAGNTVVVAASGPSLKVQDLDGARERADAVVVVNSTWTSAPWAHLLFAIDERWWTHAEPLPGQFAGLKACSDQRVRRSDIKTVQAVKPPTPCLRRGLLYRGTNSGFQAVNLAICMGAARVVMLGFDMQSTGGKAHHHGDHPRPLNNPSEQLYASWIKEFDAAAKDIEPGVEIINASRDTALRCFPRGKLEDVL